MVFLIILILGRFFFARFRREGARGVRGDVGAAGVERLLRQLGDGGDQPNDGRRCAGSRFWSLSAIFNPRRTNPIVLVVAVVVVVCCTCIPMHLLLDVSPPKRATLQHPVANISRE